MRENPGTPPRKVKNFKLLLRNGVNRAKVDRKETKREKKAVRVTRLVLGGGWL